MWSSDILNRTGSGGGNVKITTSGTLYTDTSATKYKVSIDELNTDFEKILELNPKTWYHKDTVERYADVLTRRENGEFVIISDEEMDLPYISRDAGLIAEEVLEAGFKEFIFFGPEDIFGNREVEGIHYERLWLNLIPIVRNQRDRINELESAVDSQNRTIQTLEERLKALEDLILH